MGTKGVGYGLGCKGSVLKIQRGQFYNLVGQDHGGGHVGRRSSLGLVPNYVVLVLGNVGGGPHHMQGHHT